MKLATTVMVALVATCVSAVPVPEGSGSLDISFNNDNEPMDSALVVEEVPKVNRLFDNTIEAGFDPDYKRFMETVVKYLYLIPVDFRRKETAKELNKRDNEAPKNSQIIEPDVEAQQKKRPCSREGAMNFCYHQ